MALGCFYEILLYTMMLHDIGIMQQALAADQFEPPPPPDPPPPDDAPFPTFPPSGLLRRETETMGPFEKGWAEAAEQSETKASIVKAFNYIDDRIRNKAAVGPTPLPVRNLMGDGSRSEAEVGPTPLPVRTSNSQRNLVGTRSFSSQVQLAQNVETNNPMLPQWYHNGQMPNPKTDLSFEYQSSIGRDGYEPDPLRPASEFFGPFRIDYKHHTLFLDNWNLNINSKLDRGGMGNLVVGLNQSFDRARNSVILGDSNRAVGSYGLVAGRYNMVKGRGAVITGGEHNLATGTFANVAGGAGNNATAVFASVRGGHDNLASGPFSVVSGGLHNVAEGAESTVTAGFNNRVFGNMSSINGGANNTIAVWNVSATIQGGDRVGTNVVTGPPEIIIPTAENTDNPSALAACNSPACDEEELKSEERIAAGKKRNAGHDHPMGGGEPTVRRRRSPPGVLHVHGHDDEGNAIH